MRRGWVKYSINVVVLLSDDNFHRKDHFITRCMPSGMQVKVGSVPLSAKSVLQTGFPSHLI